MTDAVRSADGLLSSVRRGRFRQIQDCYLSTGVHGHAAKLLGSGRGHGAEVAVADEVVGAHGAVQAGADHGRTVGQEGHSRDRCCVLGKRHKAEAIAGGPQLDL